jgi:hypothetical protein
MSIDLMVTPVGSPGDRHFKIEMMTGKASPMFVKYLPDHTWVAENVTMKFFTEKYIVELGALIASKQQEFCFDN